MTHRVARAVLITLLVALPFGFPAGKVAARGGRGRRGRAPGPVGKQAFEQYVLDLEKKMAGHEHEELIAVHRLALGQAAFEDVSLPILVREQLRADQRRRAALDPWR